MNSCTPSIFVAVGGALASEGPLSSVGQFIGYARGMGTSMFVVVIEAGVYLIYYWLFPGGLAS